MEASVATPGQGAPAAGAQAPAGAQGGAAPGTTAAGKGDGGQFNWGLFPDVPVEQRELLEPHLRNVQGHVTRMEQQYAPYQGLLDAVEPGQVQNLVSFLNGYSSDPVSTIVGIAQQLQQEGQLTAEHLAALTGQAQQGQAAQQQAQPGAEQMPEWAMNIMARFDSYDQQQQAAQAQQEEAQNNAMLEQAKTTMRAQLAASEITEDQVSDQMILAAIIASDGDEQAATGLLTQMRQNFLGAFANGKTGGPKAPAVEGALPGKPAGKGKGQTERGMFANANVGARQFLEQQAQMGSG